MHRFFLTVICALSLGSMHAQNNAGVDYSDGVFIVNEEWYGHNNGTINFLTNDGEWYYRVFQAENPGHELGCTSQFGTIYGNRMYLVSKQDKDPGTETMGSRLTICDALTMKVVKEFQYIAKNDAGKSVADGRSFLPVNEHKGYVGTSNGIWLFDIDNLEMGSQIKGTSNPNTDGYGSMYLGQTGSMVRANDLVFAVHQQNGILVIDAETDTLVRVMEAPVENVNGKDVQRGFGSIIMSKDGMLWASVAKDVSGSGDGMPYIIRINPYTFDTERIDIPTDKGIDMIPNSWYAWNADGFCASNKENKIYWKNLPEGGTWFSSNKIFGYDIDSREFFEVADFTKDGNNWNLYGAAFRIHPVTDEIYAFLYHDFQDPTYEIARIGTDGKIIQEYPMIENYWFPALPVFTDNAAPVVSDLFPESIELGKDVPAYSLHLADMVTDDDNMDAAIVKSVVSVTPDDSYISALVRNDSLIVACSDFTENRNAEVKVKFNSNGKVVERIINVTGNSDTGIDNVTDDNLISVYPNPAVSYIRVNAHGTANVRFYATDGSCVKSAVSEKNDIIDISGLAKGVYILRIEANGKAETIKLLKL